MEDGPLRVALLTYRGNPFCGGQGVYVRQLSRALSDLGHHVEVFAGQPYPELVDAVTLTPVPSLDLYREPDPFRWPALREYRDLVDVLETATMVTGGFPEPLTFSLRARRLLAAHRHRFDVVHDNQTLGYGLLGLGRLGLPLVTTIHHPIQIDRQLELAAATGLRRWSKRRWYAFTRMQRRVARRLPRVVTVSEASRQQITTHLSVPPDRIDVVPIGVDTDRFRADPATPRVPGRLVTTASADVPLKGLVPLLEAVAKLRTERQVELVVVGSTRPGGAVAAAMRRYDLGGAVRFTGRLSETALIGELASAEVAVVPSLFEGFSLPVVEAMACATPVVATTAGALPEVAGPDGEAALLVPPGDGSALAAAIGRLLDDPPLRQRLGAAGRARVTASFSWRAAAARTVSSYRRVRAGREVAGC
ncbi:glycosyltransferase family 4 protein [Natronosporangium hydrolyticum]|uniref:Glycosyltransferase family 4 protein n=1 Tax=Natronosporangium hydrolyticum TaxID=2811111 RepID=A0A895YI52_9ACTN|nr:glycosyltransferase family 4 protein [Natronosporangium hydrolyticum]QSB13428.1 glycosyltransferase family 4 protein [Natronosporangium hydrolyticum]